MELLRHPTLVLLWLLLFHSSLLFVFALNGNLRPRLDVYNGWKAIEIISEEDRVGALRLDENGDDMRWEIVDDMDGAGAWKPSQNVIRLLINHENSAATISQVDLDVAKTHEAIRQMILDANSTVGDWDDFESEDYVRNFLIPNDFVIDAQQAFWRWSPDLGLTWEESKNSADDADFDRFCSGQSYSPDEFDLGVPDRGFVDHLYITGEETFDSGGRMFAIDLVNRDMYQLSDAVGCGELYDDGGTFVDRNGEVISQGNCGFPSDSWENAALIDTGETKHVALVLSPDGGSENMQLYIGHKNRDRFCQPVARQSANILERNGLACGGYYYLIGDFPEEVGVFTGGALSISDDDALSSGKLEDVDTSPGNPTQVAMADETSGIFIFDFNLQFSAGSFVASQSTYTLKMLIEQSDSSADGRVNDGDNIEWTRPTVLGKGPQHLTNELEEFRDGIIFINEDDDAGEVWQINPDGTNRVLIAKANTGKATSGIFDISHLLEYAPGSILICNSFGAPSSVTMLIHPGARTEGSFSPTTSASPTVSPDPTTSPSQHPTTFPTVSSKPSASPSISVQPSLSSMPSSQPSISQAPSSQPSSKPSKSIEPSLEPSLSPSISSAPSSLPSLNPTLSNNPSEQPSMSPSVSQLPSLLPSSQPSVSANPTIQPSESPSEQPSENPSKAPSEMPSESPSEQPSDLPSVHPSEQPSSSPTLYPTDLPSIHPSSSPSEIPSQIPSVTQVPSISSQPSSHPSLSQIPTFTYDPSMRPSETQQPSSSPSYTPTATPTKARPTIKPTGIGPTFKPTTIKPTIGSIFFDSTTVIPTENNRDTDRTGIPTTEKVNMMCDEGWAAIGGVNLNQVCELPNLDIDDTTTAATTRSVENSSNGGGGCCGPVRSEQTHCHVAYTFFGENFGTVCEDCCTPPMVAPPIRQQHPTYPQIDCTSVANIPKICAKDSCCYTYGEGREEKGPDKTVSSSGDDDDDEFCDIVDQSYGADEENTGGIYSICWYCCSEPIDIASAEEDDEPGTLKDSEDWISSQGAEDGRKQIKFSVVVSVAFAINLMLFM